jgi:hypothetical protein
MYRMTMAQHKINLDLIPKQENIFQSVVLRLFVDGLQIFGICHVIC